MFQHLTYLTKHSNTLFKMFYDEMIEDAQLSKFFDSAKALDSRIVHQKNSFAQTLTMDHEHFKKYFIELGKFHYDQGISHKNFLRGTDILQKACLHQIVTNKPIVDLINELYSYMAMVKKYGTQGYIKRIVSKDRKCLQEFEEHLQARPNYPFKAQNLKKIEWLHNLIALIEHNRLAGSKALSIQYTITDKKLEIFNELETYIQKSANELIYCLKQEEYVEVLPLYQSLLRISKSSLMIHANMRQAIQDAAHIEFDSLTHLYHKAFFNEVLSKELAFQKRDEDYHFSLIYLDCDNYESVLNEYGQEMGDRVIRRLAEIIQEHIRTSDYGFRIDRDTFAIILKNAKRHIARKVVKKIATDFSAYRFVLPNDNLLHITISSGITEQSSTLYHDDIDHLRLDAEQNLIRAKNMGKDQTVI